MKNIKNKVLTVASVGVLIAALNVTGVFWEFYLNGNQPTSGYTCSSGYGYQTGYGYGYGYNCTADGTNDEGLGDARGIDVCPGNIDNSGDFYDRKCDGEGTPSANTDDDNDNDNDSSDDSNDGNSNQDNGNDTSDDSWNNNDTSGGNDDNVEGATDVVDHGDYVTPNKFASCSIIKSVLNWNATMNPFVDINNSPYKDIIIKFANAWVVHGTSATTFEPNRGITRSEFLAIVIKTHCYKFDLGSENPGFPDVSSTSWQAKVVKKWVALGLIHGYSDGTFKPNRIISKAEAYGIVSNMGILSSKANTTTTYTDLEAEWQKTMVKKLEKLGVLNAANDNYKFQPNSAVNRDQMLNFINKVISLY